MSFEYTVNSLGQRTKVETDGDAFSSTNKGWDWTYDVLGQVISAENANDSNHNRAYQYDAIGNRKKSANNLTLPGSDNYASNELNQYTTAKSINPAYDEDGNATSYPVPANPSANSALAWDAENRLIKAEVSGGATVYYHYDTQFRRVAKTIDGGTTLYVYDDWNVIAEYQLHNSSLSLQTSYTWGLDLSGDLQGAGGVGGLVAVKSGSSFHYPTYDGNGNVSEYLNSNGTVVAHFEYDPFGNTVEDSDVNGQFNYSFSTKPQDLKIGLNYYGFRYLNTETGKWLSRDPIEEEGGLNLYGSFNNDGINNFDSDGRFVNFLVGAVIGAGIDYAMQVTYNVATNGASWDAFVEIDLSSIGVSAVIGTVAPGAGRALQGISKGFKAQEKAIKLAEKVGRRKSVLNRQKLIKRAKEAANAEREAWKDVARIGASIAASKIAKKVANEVLDEIKEHLGDDICPPAQKGEFEVENKIKVNLEAALASDPPPAPPLPGPLTP